VSGSLALDVAGHALHLGLFVAGGVGVGWLLVVSRPRRQRAQRHRADALRRSLAHRDGPGA
jgi:hypothetical protein